MLIAALVSQDAWSSFCRLERRGVGRGGCRGWQGFLCMWHSLLRCHCPGAGRLLRQTLACVALPKAAACCPSAGALASRSGKAQMSPCTLLTSGCLWVRRTCLYWDGGANTSHENKTPKSRPCHAHVYADVCVHLSAGLQEVWPVGKS